MSAATEAVKPDTDTTALAIVVFGRNDVGKPRAAAFGHSDAQLAEKAAGLMGMRVLRLETDKARELAAKLPRGRVFASGRAFVPFVKAGLYDALAAFAEVSSGRGTGRSGIGLYGQPKPAKRPCTARRGPGRRLAGRGRQRPAITRLGDNRPGQRGAGSG